MMTDATFRSAFIAVFIVVRVIKHPANRGGCSDARGNQHGKPDRYIGRV